VYTPYSFLFPSTPFNSVEVAQPLPFPILTKIYEVMLVKKFKIRDPKWIQLVIFYFFVDTPTPFLAWIPYGNFLIRHCIWQTPWVKNSWAERKTVKRTAQTFSKQRLEALKYPLSLIHIGPIILGVEIIPNGQNPSIIIESYI
jgi:hypothetical protein